MSLQTGEAVEMVFLKTPLRIDLYVELVVLT
jgi:hypothetical protein